jgi:integrator complex subunit 11
MFDCGIHLAYADDRRFPDFEYMKSSFLANGVAGLDCVVVTHFHLDHVGALPILVEHYGYSGPVYMTSPTRALAPMLLEDYARIHRFDLYSVHEISRTFQRCTALDIDVSHVVQCRSACPASINVAPPLKLTMFYAGHVLGAAMALVECNGESVFYTGDFNSAPDGHLDAARPPTWRSMLPSPPSLLITETTYATSVGEQRFARETEFLNCIQACVQRGGQVLIPVFAVGRAQELCLLLENLWEREELLQSMPIYIAGSMSMEATDLYSSFSAYAGHRCCHGQRTTHQKPFSFQHVSSLGKSALELAQTKPWVCLAAPGMLHSGTSLEIFKHIAHDPNNLVLIPGYCVQGSVGHRLMQAGRTNNAVEGVTVRCSVQFFTFAAHADAAGILTLIRDLEPASVMLVHGDREKMQTLHAHITQQIGVHCVYPANGEITSFMNSPEKMAVELKAAADTVMSPYSTYELNDSRDTIRHISSRCNDLHARCRLTFCQTVQFPDTFGELETIALASILLGEHVIERVEDDHILIAPSRIHIFRRYRDDENLTVEWNMQFDAEADLVIQALRSMYEYRSSSRQCGNV